MASDLQGVTGFIESYLADNITSIDAGWTSGANVAWPGIDFDPPSEWVRPTIIWGDGFLETMSATGTSTVPGILVLSFFDRPGSGYGTLLGYADAARDLFDRLPISLDPITNGGFDSDSDWTKGTNWQITGGVASLTNTGSGVPQGSLTQTLDLINGATYSVTYTVANRTAKGVYVSIGGTAGTTRTTNGTFREAIVAGSGSTIAFDVTDNDGGGWDGDIDDVSVTILTGVQFLAASGPRQVNTNDTRWLQINLSIPFLVEESS